MPCSIPKKWPTAPETWKVSYAKNFSTPANSGIMAQVSVIIWEWL